MSEKELTDFIKKEIKYIPCFFCIDGYLKLKGIEYMSKVIATVYCNSCGQKNKMQFDF